MVNPLSLLPAGVLVLALAAWALDKTEGRGERAVAGVARALFGRVVSSNGDRERVIEAAFLDTTYTTYAAKTSLFTLLGFVGGAVAGGYAVAALLLVLEPLLRTVAQLPNTITARLGLTPEFELVLSDGTWWGIVLGGGLVAGVVVAVGAYYFRWKLPESNAEVRRRSIEEGLPRTVAFMYALSRGGMNVPDILRTLGRNREVYGETASEMTVATREMDLFGRDIVTAVRRMARRSPSEQFKTFAENFASVLQSGSSLPDFLRTQYDRFQAEAEERQEEVIDLLATIAEGYVTVLVAGVLFLITILMVFGLTTTDTLWLLQLMAYLIIPLANAGFVVYLSQKLEALGIGQRSAGTVLDRYTPETPVKPALATDRDGDGSTRRADGGVGRDAATATQLRWYDRLSRVKGFVRSPLRTLRRNPTAVLYVTVPLAVLVFVLRLPEALLGVGINLRVLDDLVVQSLLFVLVTFAVARELYKRRIDRIEAATPDLLDRLASLNEAGMSVVEGFDRVRGSDLGVLSPEVERIWRDLQYGSNVDDALVRFGRRVRTRSITRVVVLLTNAMKASGQMGDVIRIAADQARAELNMRRKRRQQMLTYLVVIYISFLVFLVIILAVKQVLVPSLPESVPNPTGESINRLGVDTDQFSRIGRVDKAAYTLVFFHTALIQAVCSGFVAGLLGEGTLKDGAKHAAILVGLAYVVFVLLSAPVSSIAAGDQVEGTSELTLESVSMSDGGFVVVQGDSINSTVIGRTGYLEPGTHRNVTVSLDETLREGEEVLVVTHLDTNDNHELDYRGPPWIPSNPGVDRPYSPLAGGAKPGIEVRIG
jgi:flagellar protein FlaJ